MGALLGLAVGDALGTTLEFQPPGTFTPITDMVGGGPFHLQPGQWTDDTSMALCLAESLIVCQGSDLVDQLQRYQRWRSEGHWSATGRCFDIGNTVSRALSHFATTGDAYSGASDEHSAGNGSLMRLAPIAVYFQHDPELAIQMAGESSKTTHGNLMAIDACRYFAGLLIGAIQGAHKETLLSPAYSPIDGFWQREPLHPAINKIAMGSFKEREPPKIRGSGFVVESLEAALWAFFRSSDFREGALLAANLGDDADTTAAIFGQIGGAFYGYHALPPQWLSRLSRKDEITALFAQLGGCSSDFSAG
ncbi:MAG: ADP-ribosylglycohydrolase family protein [Gammaproteobacteria bacterium]|nr:ADP-ribosylglycohydrolase family protein [Gammaproteobacteria bacterium]